MSAIRMDSRLENSRRRENSGALLLNALDKLGANSGEFVRSIGIDAGPFAVLDLPTPFARLAQALQRASEFAGCEHLGIVLGSQGKLPSLSKPGQRMIGAPAIMSALVAAYDGLSLQDNGVVVELTLGDTACLSYIVVDPALDTAATISDCAMAITSRVLAELFGPMWAPELTELARRMPQDPRPYRRVFKSPIVFNSNVAAIHFSGRWLHQSRAMGDPSPSVVSRMPQHGFLASDLSKRVIEQLAHNIADGGRTSARDVARMFGICGRTLQRELNKEHTSYRALSEDMRFGMSKRLLHDTDLSITEIAIALGYSDISVLTRAFTRWTGQSPSEWRISKRRSFISTGGATKCKITDFEAYSP